ncbi:T9SS type A sorting domain-containing protein [Bacteroidales bacterium AH-315-N07]|nr:T9SS type A sorting domain-containing protein [Bacteroidales bacterium AH-315-N07]
MVFVSSDTVLFGNDGGIWKCDNFTDSIPYIYSRNFTYNVTQYYAGAIHPEAGNPKIIGGTQDNGSSMATGDGISHFHKLTGADGSFCAIDHQNGDILYTSMQFKKMWRFTNGGFGNYDTITNPHIKKKDAQFINPIEMDPTDPDIIYQATRKGLYRLKNASTVDSASLQTMWGKACKSVGEISAIGVSKNKPYYVYIGMNGGRINRIEGADTTDSGYRSIDCDPLNMLPGTSYVNCIYVNPDDEKNVVVVLSNYGIKSIFESKDATSDSAIWQSVEGNLPDIPVYWALLHPTDTNVCYIATGLGVFYTKQFNGDNTIWEQTNDGLAYVRTDMIRLRSSDNTVLAVTHGRGLFTGKINSSGSNYEIKWKERGPSNVGGRTRTIVLDPNDPTRRTYWAGSVSGGLWKNENIDYEEEFEEPPVVPVNEYKLGIKSSNPFTSNITFEYSVPNTENISFLIFDIYGRLVDIIINDEPVAAGIYTVQWRPNTILKPGIYFAVLSHGNSRNLVKIVKMNSL